MPAPRPRLAARMRFDGQSNVREPGHARSDGGATGGISFFTRGRPQGDAGKTFTRRPPLDTRTIASVSPGIHAKGKIMAEKVQKTATAIRMSGNVYDVRYPGEFGVDRKFTLEQVKALPGKGYHVTVIER